MHRLGSSLVEGTKWDYSDLASQEITELDQIASRLERQVTAEEEKERLRDYISATRDLLQLMKHPPLKKTHVEESSESRQR